MPSRSTHRKLGIKLIQSNIRNLAPHVLGYCFQKFLECCTKTDLELECAGVLRALIWLILTFLPDLPELPSWRGGSLNDCNDKIVVLQCSRIDFHWYDAPLCVEDLYLHLILLVGRFGGRNEARK